jgi:hypothetical protein
MHITTYSWGSSRLSVETQARRRCPACMAHMQGTGSTCRQQRAGASRRTAGGARMHHIQVQRRCLAPPAHMHGTAKGCRAAACRSWHAHQGKQRGQCACITHAQVHGRAKGCRAAARRHITAKNSCAV